jgi:hypothetical protein
MDINKLESDQSYATRNNQYPDYSYRESEEKEDVWEDEIAYEQIKKRRLTNDLRIQNT